MKMKTEEQVVMRVSATSIAVNLLLSLFKLLAGIFGHSAAMISDAVHSASDVFSTVIVIAGVKIAGKDADSEHQYGHDRFECVASVVLAIVLGATGLGIGLSGVDKIRSGEYGSFAVPGMMAMIAALVSIAVKEWMFWYTKSAAKKVNCSALMADAWHHRSDAMSSIGSFVGILGARLGFPIFDSLASIVICVLILKAAVEIFLDAMKKMIRWKRCVGLCWNNLVWMVSNLSVQECLVPESTWMWKSVQTATFRCGKPMISGKRCIRELKSISKK